MVLGIRNIQRLAEPILGIFVGAEKTHVHPDVLIAGAQSVEGDQRDDIAGVRKSRRAEFANLFEVLVCMQES